MGAEKGNGRPDWATGTRLRVAELRQRDAVDQVLASRGRPTVERVERAGGAVVELTTEDAGVTATRMLDTADHDRRRMRALPKVNRWAAETLRRVYLLARREPVVVSGYGESRMPGELPAHVAYAETLVSRCRRDAVRHWPVLRAALIDERWVIDEARLRTALRWLAGWWRRVELLDGERWEDLADALVLEVRDEDGGDDRRPAMPTPWHLWIAMACEGEGLPTHEVARLAEEIGAAPADVWRQLTVWQREGVVGLDTAERTSYRSLGLREISHD